MKISLVFPILALILILLFLSSLPALRSCSLPRAELDPAPRTKRRERLAVTLVTLLYAIVAFTRLGSTAAPQSYRQFTSGESYTLTLAESSNVRRAMVYSSINVGSYSFALSEDGESFAECATLDQNYANLLRWHELELIGSGKYLRITAAGNAPELGEIALYDERGALLPWAETTSLTDEQNLVPLEPNFLNSSYFDEIYHARTAEEHLRGMWPYEISHPPLGKLILSVGIALFGMTPFGWRFMGTLFGVLMLPVLYAFARRLFGSKAVPTCCTVLFAADFMHYTQTRIATIDTYAVFFILLMYLFFYRYLEEESLTPDPRRWSRCDTMLALSGLFFGLGAASKWTCLYAGAGLGLLWLLHWASRLAREKQAALRPFCRNVLLCLGFFVLVPAVIYYCSYYPYGIGKGLGGGIGMYFTRDYARIVLDNQDYMFTYHSSVTASHPYASRWYQWVLDIRPILYYLDYSDAVTRSSFGAFVNPILCWAGFFALFVLGYCALFRRDNKAGFLLLGYLAQLVPWMFISRCTFEYHYFPCTVFLILALGYVFSLLRENKRDWRLSVYGLTALTVAVFALFYPQLSGQYLNSTLAADLYQWLPTWPF